MAFAPNGIPEAPRNTAPRPLDSSATGYQQAPISWLKGFTSTSSAEGTDEPGLADKPAVPASLTVTADGIRAAINNGGKDAADALVDGTTGAQVGGQAGSEIGLNEQIEKEELAKKNKKDEDDPEDANSDDNPLIPFDEVAVGAAGLTAGAIALWNFAKHLGKKLFGTTWRMIRKAIARHRIKVAKKKVKKLEDRHARAKQLHDDAHRRKIEAGKHKDKLAGEGASEADQKAAREAADEAARLAARKAEEVEKLKKELQLARARLVERLERLEHFKRMDAFTRPFRWASVAIPAIFATGAVIYLGVRRGEFLSTIASNAKTTMGNWLYHIIPSDIREAAEKGDGTNAPGSGARAVVGQVDKDARVIADKATNFFHLAVKDPGEAAREFVEGTDKFAHDTVDAVTDTATSVYRFVTNQTPETVENAVKGATIFPDAIAANSRAADQAVGAIMNGEISQDALLGVAGAVVNDPAALQSATDLANTLAPPTPSPSSRRPVEPPAQPPPRNDATLAPHHEAPQLADR